MPNGKQGSISIRLESHDRHLNFRYRSLRCANRLLQHLGLLGKSQILKQFRLRNGSIGLVVAQLGEWAPRADDGLQQAPRGEAFAEVEPGAENWLDNQMPRERPHNVIEPLADQHHTTPG